MPDFTTAELLTEVRQRAALAVDQDTWDAEAILREATNVAQSACTARLRAFGQGYQETFVDYAIGSSVLRVPPRCLGQLRDVQYAQGGDARQLASLANVSTPEEAEPRQAVAQYFRLSGDTLHLPEHMTSGLLRLYYLLRPSKLVEASRCAQVTAVAGATITVSSVPSNIAVNSLVDLVSLTPPSFRPRMIDVEVSSIAGTDITLATAPTGTQVPSVGEYVCTAQESCVAQVPFEMYPYLWQQTAVNILATQKAMSELAAGARLRLADELNNAKSLLADRVDGEPHVLINHYSPLRLGVAGGFGRGRR